MHLYNSWILSSSFIINSALFVDLLFSTVYFTNGQAVNLNTLENHY